jgi:hypothetical protein
VFTAEDPLEKQGNDEGNTQAEGAPLVPIFCDLLSPVYRASNLSICSNATSQVAVTLVLGTQCHIKALSAVYSVWTYAEILTHMKYGMLNKTSYPF